MLVKVKCMTCPKTVEIETNEYIATATVLLCHIAERKNWAFSNSKNGVFLCCEECYEECFDTSVGKVGRLKKEYDKLRIKDERSK